MTCTVSTGRFSPRRFASPPRCKSPLSRCRSKKNLKRSYNRNQQYSITAITDASGGIVERYAYTAYGTRTVTDASGTTRTTTAIGNRYKYTGREWDETLALYHYRARMYDSVGGRFVSRDPIEFDSGDFSMYRYVENSPAVYVDPSGLKRSVVKTFTYLPHNFIRVYRNDNCAKHGCRCKYPEVNPKGCVDLHFSILLARDPVTGYWTQYQVLPSAGGTGVPDPTCAQSYPNDPAKRNACKSAAYDVMMLFCTISFVPPTAPPQPVPPGHGQGGAW